jgi:hypothetical protein
MDKLKKLREKKGHSKMHPLEQKAKMGVVDDLSKMAEAAMGDKLKHMNKVTVASDSKEGLQHGLSHAEDVLGKLPQAYDDSHRHHENFAHTERPEDGMDGDSAYPDADSAHHLEADPSKEHEHDEDMEGHGRMMAEGGEVEEDDDLAEVGGDAADEGEMPAYNDMDEGEMDSHLQALVAAMKKRGMMNEDEEY